MGFFLQSVWYGQIPSTSSITLQSSHPIHLHGESIQDSNHKKNQGVKNVKGDPNQNLLPLIDEYQAQD